MFFNLAADSYQGIWGTTHGRSYGIYVKYPDFEGTAALCWLLFGTGSLTKGTSGMAPVCLATSTYKPPKIIFDMATDNTSVIEVQGAARHPAHVGAPRRFCRLSHARLHAVRLAGSSQGRVRKLDARGAGDAGQQGASSFGRARTPRGEGSGLRPDYWSGNSVMPRVIQHKNVMSLTFRLNEFTWMSHAWFPQELFDEVRLVGNWAFVRVKQGYVGIYSQNGMQVGDDGQYAGRELQCWAQENTWLVECGREADWGSFDAFVNALSAGQHHRARWRAHVRIAFGRSLCHRLGCRADGQRRADPVEPLPARG